MGKIIPKIQDINGGQSGSIERDVGGFGPPPLLKFLIENRYISVAEVLTILDSGQPNVASEPGILSARRLIDPTQEEQQAVLVLHQSRDLLTRQRTMILNSIRSHCAEFGIIAAQGARKVSELVTKLRNDDTLGVPEVGVSVLLSLASQLDCLEQEVRKIEHQLLAWYRQNAASQRLETIPGIGLITAMALAASVPDPAVFKSGRQFAAYLGLIPRQNSSGGKGRLGRISKMGNGYLRRLLVVGATSVTRRAPTTDTRTGTWVRSLLERKPTRVVTVAIANKTAHTAWALLSKGESYKAVPAI